MIKAYRVAGHTFHLEMPDGFRLWELLSQYDPFEVSLVDAPLFQLTVVKELPDVEKTPLLVEEPEPGATKIALYDAGDNYYIEMAPYSEAPVSGYLLVGKDMRRASLMISARNAAAAQFAVNNSLMLIYAFATADKMTLEMHSSVVVNEGRGYMFLGKSGTGKSTHSSLWLKYVPGSELLNDDNPIIRIGDDGIARVFGSPWSGKTPCYRNADAPVGAVVRIVQAPENVIFRYGVLESYASIYSSCSGFKADRAMSDGLHRTLEQLALNVPCYKLECLPDEGAALLCSNTVKANQ